MKPAPTRITIFAPHSPKIILWVAAKVRFGSFSTENSGGGKSIHVRSTRNSDRKFYAGVCSFVPEADP